MTGARGGGSQDHQKMLANTFCGGENFLGGFRVRPHLSFPPLAGIPVELSFAFLAAVEAVNARRGAVSTDWSTVLASSRESRPRRPTCPNGRLFSTPISTVQC